MPELMDIYDENRKLTGRRVERKTAFLKEGEFFLYVLAIIENQEGKLLLTKRAMDKKWAAGCWEIPGGGSQSGESSYQAVCREVYEETGLDLASLLPASEPAPIDSYRNVDLARGDNYFVDIYHFKLNFSEKDIAISTRESSDYCLAAPEELPELEKRDGFLHYQRLLHALSL